MIHSWKVVTTFHMKDNSLIFWAYRKHVSFIFISLNYSTIKIPSKNYWNFLAPKQFSSSHEWNVIQKWEYQQSSPLPSFRSALGHVKWETPLSHRRWLYFNSRMKSSAGFIMGGFVRGCDLAHDLQLNLMKLYLMISDISFIGSSLGCLSFC